jgi:hypothetical protein
VAGAIIIILVLVVAIPVGFLVTMGIVAGVLGWTVKTEVDDDFAGTEDLTISRM